MSEPINFSLQSRLADMGMCVTFVYATGKPNAESLMCTKYWQLAQRKIMDLDDPGALLQHPHILGYRALHKTCGVSDPNLVPSPESLITLLLKAGELRSIEPIVDLYNAVSLNHLISIGAHDAAKLGGELRLSMNSGGERFQPIGQKKKITLPAEEYSYKAADHKPVCRLECKQSNESKLRADTKRWVFILQGNENIDGTVLETAATELLYLVQSHWADVRTAQATLDSQNLTATLLL